MSRKPQRPKLSIRRTRIRTLTDEALENVVGGTIVVSTLLPQPPDPGTELAKRTQNL